MIREQTPAMGSGKTAGGYFTVEAAFIMPVIVLLLVWLVSLAIGLYENVAVTAEAIDAVTEIDAPGMFRTITGVSDVLGIIGKGTGTN